MALCSLTTTGCIGVFAEVGATTMPGLSFSPASSLGTGGNALAASEGGTMLLANVGMQAGIHRNGRVSFGYQRTSLSVGDASANAEMGELGGQFNFGSHPRWKVSGALAVAMPISDTSSSLSVSGVEPPAEDLNTKRKASSFFAGLGATWFVGARHALYGLGGVQWASQEDSRLGTVSGKGVGLRFGYAFSFAPTCQKCTEEEEGERRYKEDVDADRARRSAQHERDVAEAPARVRRLLQDGEFDRARSVAKETFGDSIPPALLEDINQAAWSAKVVRLRATRKWRAAVAAAESIAALSPTSSHFRKDAADLREEAIKFHLAEAEADRTHPLLSAFHQKMAGAFGWAGAVDVKDLVTQATVLDPLPEFNGKCEWVPTILGTMLKTGAGKKTAVRLELACEDSMSERTNPAETYTYAIKDAATCKEKIKRKKRVKVRVQRCEDALDPCGRSDLRGRCAPLKVTRCSMVEEWQDGKETEWVEQEEKCDKRVEATRKVDERLFHASINGTLQVVADGRSRVPVTISLDAADKEFSSPHGSQRFTLTREQHRANAVKKLADSITAELAAIKVATGNAEASRARSLANSVARDAEELSLSALLRGCTEGSATDWLTNSYELNRAELSAAFYGGLRLHK